MNTKQFYSIPMASVFTFFLEDRFLVNSNTQSSGEDFEFEEE